MTLDQIIVFAILASALLLFVFSRWRYDLVALIALFATALSGTIPLDRAFYGFGHPAVITVAAVLVISRSLQNSGVVDGIASILSRIGTSRFLQLTVMTAFVTLISGFINNVGALALMMPVAIHMSRKNNWSPSFLLMPLAFGSLVGGLLTQIGTPPNIIIGAARAATGHPPFGMFAFTPVGAGVAAAGFLYIILIGRFLIPQRKGSASGEELFHIKEYTTEVRVPEESKAVGKRVSELEKIADAEVAIIGVVRGKRRLLAPSGFETIRENDILIVEAGPDALKAFTQAARLELEAEEEEIEEMLKSEEVALAEAIVSPRSSILGKSARNLHMRWRYGINLLGVAREGQRLDERIGRIRFKIGDILLLQGPAESMPETLSSLGCLPLAKRNIRLGQPRRIILSLAIFGAAIVSTVAGLFPVTLAFPMAALMMTLFNLITLREMYESIDWPVIILLGAMIPLGEALENTGGAHLIGAQIVELTSTHPPQVTLSLLLVITMALSNIMNNAAVAVLMAPIAISISQGLAASADPFLMTVAVGASCTFLTPIGHQSNALVMGPGGYHFGDYWRMGLLLSLLVVAVTIPLVLTFWPL